MGGINVIPFIGWLLSFVGTVSLSIPFWIAWTNMKIGERFFYFLPTVWQSIGFWDCVWLFMAVFIIKAVFVPTLINSSSSSKTN